MCRKKFCQRSFLAIVPPKFPDHLIPRMGALCFYAPYLKEHGCAGVSYTAYGLIMQELERADSGVRSLASVQGALAIQAIHSFGSPEQHARWLPGLALVALFSAGALMQAWAMKREPLGSSYVVVLGLEALLAVLAGYFLFAEQMTIKMISGVVLVILGMILLRLP